MGISYLSGFWWLIGFAGCYILAILIVKAIRHYWWRHLFRTAREARQRQWLHTAKDKEES